MAIAVGQVGATALRFVGLAGAWVRLGTSAAWWAVVGPFRSRVLRPRLIMLQTERVGAHSVPVILLVAALIGVILVLQTASTLRQYGQADLVPKMVAISIVRELGPLITALILAGRVGAAFTAEIGTMVVSEEVQALEAMGIPPVAYLVAPRLAACVTMVPCLTLAADAVGMAGGYLAAWGEFGMDLSVYVARSAEGLTMRALVLGEVKAAIFGALIAVIACHRALAVRGSSEEVGRATMQSVVTAMVAIIAADSVVTAVDSAWA